jgi:hypothetical protein
MRDTKGSANGKRDLQSVIPANAGTRRLCFKHVQRDNANVTGFPRSRE